MSTFELVTGFAIYFIIWWLVIFMVLPFGVRRPDADELEPGQDHGAPVKSHIWKKLAVTTVISAVIFAILYGAWDQGWIALQEPQIPS